MAMRSRGIATAPAGRSGFAIRESLQRVSRFAGAFGTRALSDLMGPFDRDYFVPWLGALRNAMPWHRMTSATRPRGQKNPAFGGPERLIGCVATLARHLGLGGPTSRPARRACPNEPLWPIK